MVYFPIEDTQQNKEPWLAVSLSWLVPGCGQFYLKNYVRGVIFVMLIGLFYLIWIASLVSTECSFVLTIAIGFCGFTILPVFACVDAFKITKKSNSDEFEKERALSKDPWIAVFLSLLLPGLGHVYIRKSGFLVLYIFIFLVLHISSRRILSLLAIYVIIALFLFRALVCIHAYAASPVHRERKKNAIIIFAVVLVLVQCLSRLFVPWLNTKYLVEFCNPTLGQSMSPTIKDGDRIIVNKRAYDWDKPEIGDIVTVAVYKNENEFCKRIVAVGGETVQVKDGQVYVNGEKISFRAIEDFGNDPNEANQITDGVEKNSSYPMYGVGEPYRVPEGCYFVLGDNIQSSLDSRFYGAFPEDKIIGKVVKIYLPFHRSGTLY